MFALFKNVPGNVPKRGAASDAAPPTSAADSVNIDPLVGADSRETKKIKQQYSRIKYTYSVAYT